MTNKQLKAKVEMLEQSNIELRQRIAALEAKPVYVPVFPPVNVPSVWPVFPNTYPDWTLKTTCSAGDTDWVPWDNGTAWTRII